MLRIQQQLLQRMKRVEKVLRSSHLGGHRLQYQRQHLEHAPPPTSTPCSYLHTPTASSSSGSLQNTLTVTSSPSVSFFRTPTLSATVPFQHTLSATSSPSLTLEASSTPHLLPVPNIPAPTLPHFSTSGESSSGRPVVCPRLVHKQTSKCLPSAAIVSTKLVLPSEVIARYPKLLVAKKAPTLAVKLAREAFFGDDLMGQCTVMGCREYPGLPSAELCRLKETLFSQFPAFWNNPVDFEGVWASCVDAIGQACKRFIIHVRQTNLRCSSCCS